MLPLYRPHTDPTAYHRAPLQEDHPVFNLPLPMRLYRFTPLPGQCRIQATILQGAGEVT